MPVTGTGPSVLTVSSRTEPDTGHPPATGTLTPDDANPPLRAHRESRRTAGGGLNADLAPVSSYPSRPSGTPRHGRSCCPASTTCRHSDAPAGHSPPLADFLNHRRISHLRRNSPASLPIQSAQKRTTCAGQDPGQAHPPDRSYSLGSGHWPMDALLSGLGLSPSVMVSADLPWVSRRLLGPSAGPASGSQPEPRRCLMATTTPSIALVPATPVFTTTERLALAGFLAGIAA